jgi:phosphoglycolate phosphatase
MKAVIFDLDGTLVDSAADLQAAANRLMRRNGLPELDRATITCFIGNGIARLVERCFARHGSLPGDLPAQTARFKQFYAEEQHRRTRFMPGAEAALRRLAASGLTLGLCTNKDSEPALAILRRLHADGLFRAVVGGDSGLARKPDPAPLTACLSACGFRWSAEIGSSFRSSAVQAWRPLRRHRVAYQRRMSVRIYRGFSRRPTSVSSAASRQT